MTETAEFGPSERREIQLQAADRESDAGGARCPGAEGQSRATGDRESHGGAGGGPNISDPALWPTKMTDSDRVNVVVGGHLRLSCPGPRLSAGLHSELK